MARSEVIRVRLTPEERAALTALRGSRQTESEVIRLLFRERAGLPLPVGPVHADRLTHATEELRLLVVGVNKAIRTMNEGNAAYAAELDDVLHGLLKALMALREDIDLILQISRSETRGGARGA